MGLVCLVCGDETDLELPFSPSVDPRIHAHTGGPGVPGSHSASCGLPVVQAVTGAAPSHEET